MQTRSSTTKARARSRQTAAKQPKHGRTRALLATERVVARRCPVHLGGTHLGPRREAAEGAHFRFEKGLSRPTRTTQQASTPAIEYTCHTNTRQKAASQLKATTHLFPIYRYPNPPPWALLSKSRPIFISRPSRGHGVVLGAAKASQRRRNKASHASQRGRKWRCETFS